MLFFPYKKATLLIPSSPNNQIDIKHLFIILTNPNKDNDVLLVNISSIKPNRPFDQTSILSPGIHKFIRKDSFVNYKQAIIVSGQILINKVKSGEFVPYEIVTDELFNIVINGINSSKEISLKIKNFYNLHCS